MAIQPEPPPLGAGGCHKGELTLVGQLQARALGEWLRSRYVAGSGGGGADGTAGFLPAAHAQGIVSAQTTNYRRTVGTL